MRKMMAIAQVTPEYVNLVTNNQYVTRTANTSEFQLLRQMLAEAWLSTNICRLPDRKFTHGLALLIAHYYTTGPKDGAGGSGGAGAGEIPSDSSGGPITSESVGDIAISYGSSSASSGGGSSTDNALGAWLGESAYGRQFLALMKTSKPLPIVT
jgi:hypothetical protein